MTIDPAVQAALDKIKGDVDAVAKLLDKPAPTPTPGPGPTPPPPPPPPAPKLTLSNMQATVGAGVAIVTVDCSPDIVNVTLQESGSKVAGDVSPVQGRASWTLSNLSPGAHALAAQGWNSPSGQPGQASSSVTASVTIPTPTPPPPPPGPPPTPPPLGSATVNAKPAGVTVPSDGWKVVAADAFNPSHPLSSLWIPNRNAKGGDQPGFNSNEVAHFNASQVALTNNGVELTAKCLGNRNYVSGAMTSQQGPGYCGNGGFSWQPVDGQVIVLETVMTLPHMRGADPGYWGYYDGRHDGSWIEFDYFEAWEYGADNAIGIPVWFTSGGSRQEHTQYDDGHSFIQHDGKQHRITHEINGNTHKVNVYIDGTLLSTIGWPSMSLPLTGDSWFQVLCSFALRDVGQGVGPDYTVGTTGKWTIRSFACYVNGSADTSKSIKGGIIAPGTVLI